MRNSFLTGLTVLLCGAVAASAAATTPAELIQLNCASCHSAPDSPGGGLTRMQEQRKTPEGWQMTLVRMHQLHKVAFTDPAGGSAEDTLRVLVKHFADTQGLSPSESARYRFILERRLSTVDVHEDAEFAVMCARCHSAARVGLQRRSESEWRHLMHFHLAQFPTVEYSAGGRDRDWRGTALNRMVPMLTQQLPFQSQEWSDWQAAPKPQLAGTWRLVGAMPGKGAFDAVMTATLGEGDNLELKMSGRYADGETLEGSGTAIVYTGYEWRATITAGERSFQQVLAANPDGSTLSGRMFLTDQEETGIDLKAVRNTGQSQLLAIDPPYLKPGSEQTVTLVGTALAGKPGFGPGISVVETVSQDPDRVVVKIKTSAEVALGKRAVQLGNASLADALIVYAQVDRLVVTPPYSVGRVGDSEGSQPPVRAIFEAVAYSNGPDSAAATADDLRIGVMPASWSVEPWDDKATADNDVKFAGAMGKDNGVFTPAGAGPNPERKYQTNNAGNLKVIATVKDGEQQLKADAHLLVTVQRWNNPPIR